MGTGAGVGREPGQATGSVRVSGCNLAYQVHVLNNDSSPLPHHSQHLARDALVIAIHHLYLQQRKHAGVRGFGERERGKDDKPSDVCESVWQKGEGRVLLRVICTKSDPRKPRPCSLTDHPILKAFSLSCVRARVCVCVLLSFSCWLAGAGARVWINHRTPRNGDEE